MLRIKFAALAAVCLLWSAAPATAQRWGGHGHGGFHGGYGGYRGFGGYGGFRGGYGGFSHGFYRGGYGHSFYPRYGGYGGYGYSRAFYPRYGYGGLGVLSYPSLYGYASGYGGYASGYGGYPYAGYSSYGTTYYPDATTYYPSTIDNTLYLDSGVAVAPPANVQQSMYYAPEADNKARIRVHMPTADAKLWVDGQPTTTTGEDREFASPALTPGRTYSYQLKARWTENGKEVERTSTVQIRPNETSSVSFGGEQ